MKLPSRNRYYLRFWRINIAQSIVVALLAGRYRDAETVLRRRQRARRVGGEGAGRVLQSIEIEPDFTGLDYAMVGKFGIQKAPRTVRRSFAGGVAKNKEQIG